MRGFDPWIDGYAMSVVVSPSNTESKRAVPGRWARLSQLRDVRDVEAVTKEPPSNPMQRIQWSSDDMYLRSTSRYVEYDTITS
jgi:hypothetical protein